MIRLFVAAIYLWITILPASGEEGIASFYSRADSGSQTASGETLDDAALTAAHKSLPLHSIVRVTHKITGKSVIVRINDRGPYIEGRIIDLTLAAAAAIGLTRDAGVCAVTVERFAFPSP